MKDNIWTRVLKGRQKKLERKQGPIEYAQETLRAKQRTVAESRMGTKENTASGNSDSTESTN